jgi:hypothetical protein
MANYEIPYDRELRNMGKHNDTPRPRLYNVNKARSKGGKTVPVRQIDRPIRARERRDQQPARQREF